MPGSRGRSIESLRREQPEEVPRPRFLVVCEGTVTEPEYFKKFSFQAENQLVDVEIEGRSEDPLYIVERAAQWKREAAEQAEVAGNPYKSYDHVWCVFDVDEHERFNEAVELAEEEDILLAVSNPCFELWALLHFEFVGGAGECGRFRELLSQHVQIDGREIPFDPLWDRYEDALENSRRLWRERVRAGRRGGNPSTRVFALTEHIRRYGRKLFLRHR